MKKFKYILAIAALILGVASCTIMQEDAFSTDPVAPEFLAHGDILMTANTMDEDVNFTWTAYRNLPEGLSYVLKATYLYDTKQLVTVSDATYYKTTKTAFKDLLYTTFPDLPVNDTFVLSFEVSVLAPSGDEYTSNSMGVTIYAYGDAIAPVISLVQTELVLDPTDALAEVELLSWEPARLVYGEDVTYNVYLSTVTATTTATKAASVPDYLLAEGLTATSYSSTTDALNEAVIAAGGAEAAEVPVRFLVQAVCASLPEGVEATSEEMTITTYLTTFPDILYVPGSHQGWDPASAPTLKLSTSIKGYYEGIVDLTTADGSNTKFKFSPNPEWKDDFGGKVDADAEKAGFYSGTVGVSDDIEVASGVYVFQLNKKLNTLNLIEIKSLGAIGTAFGGWSDEVTMEWNKETHVFTVTADIVPGAYKFRLNNDWTFSIDDSLGINGGGSDFETSLEGNYKVSVDMSSHPYRIKFADTAYPEVLYVPGSHNGWDHTKTILQGDGEGHFEGYISVGGEWGFKLTPQADWAAGEWGFDKSTTPQTSETGETTWSLTRSEAGNIMEGSEVTYARVMVDLTDLSVKVFPIQSVEICGTFTEWSVQDDFKMAYSADSDSWKIEGVTIPKGGQWKFRMNDDGNWTANLGYGSLSDLVQDGSNITDTEPGVYTIELFLGSLPYHATLTKTGEADAPVLPETMYIIGEAVGGWDWEANGQDMTPVHSKDGAFWAIRYLEAGQGFKFCQDKAWGRDFTNLGSDDSGYTVDGGNCYVAESGLYMIAIDCAAEKVIVEPAKVWGFGPCFNGWEGDPSAFTVDGAKVVSPALQAGSLRMYATASCYDVAWWQMEFNVFDGKIAYRGAGGEQAEVACTAGQKVTLDFNAGTGVIE